MDKYIFAAVIFFLFGSSLALAQTGPQLLATPNLSESEAIEGRADALVLAQGSTSNNSDNYQLNIFETNGRVREERQYLVPRLGWDLTYMNIDSSDPSLPKNLTDVSVAAGVELGTYYDYRAGLTVGVGYAGDRPFEQSSAWFMKATLLLGRKLDDKTTLAFLVDYDGNRSSYPDIPFPGVAYVHEYDPHLSYTLGVPLSSVTWKPIDSVKINATWTLLDRFDARVEYSLASHWIVYGNLEARQEAFHIEGADRNDRLLFQNRRAEVGVQCKPLKDTQAHVAVGYSFGGEFSHGWDQTDSRLVADLGDVPYVRVGFERRF